MKNIHILPTDKPSRVYKNEIGELGFTNIKFTNNDKFCSNQHIYITSDEEIKVGDWFVHSSHGITNIYKAKSVVTESIITTCDNGCLVQYCKKIILTTDQDLINDGVQAIEDEFLEWFVKNPSCQEIDVNIVSTSQVLEHNIYKIIIPNKEQKQHLINMMRGDEELGLYESWVKDAEKESNLSDLNDKANAFWGGYRAGIKAKERMYSEENMHEYAEFIIRCYLKKLPLIIAKDWFQEIKNK